MAELEVDRSINFVSLDTHPAYDALVVTYEVLVTVADACASDNELTRRTKRDQLLVKVATLDSFVEFVTRPDVLMVKLQELAEKIVHQFSLLQSVDIEDIKLHLLYLVNRKHSQARAAPGTRPPSSVSAQLRPASRLAQERSRTSLSARRPSANSELRHGTRRVKGDLASDVYNYLCAKYTKSCREKSNVDDQQEYQVLDDDEYLHHFMVHLDKRKFTIRQQQQTVQPTPGNIEPDLETLDAHIEGLYGDDLEQRVSMETIYQLALNNKNLFAMSSNRLLLCALVRNIRDSDTIAAQANSCLCEQILFCLIRLTTYQDVCQQTLCTIGNSLDLYEVLVGALNKHATGLNEFSSARYTREQFYVTNSLLVILMNLFKNNKADIRSNLLKQHGELLAVGQVRLLCHVAKSLMRDIRQSSLVNQLTNNRPERISSTLARLVTLLVCLSTYKDFVINLRSKSHSKQFVESTLNTLNVLQLCRPASGTSAPTTLSFMIVDDQSTLNQLYEIEINLLKLINNLIHDAKLVQLFTKKTLLLKCVLRNLVVFLATSRLTNTLEPFDKTPVLLVPFKCLYELSCRDSIKSELYKSKIVMKCLMEYLLSSIEGTRAVLVNSSIAQVDSSTASTNIKSITDTPDQIYVDPDNANYYIVALIINLSARKSASFFSISDTNEELRESLIDYLDLTTSTLVQWLNQLMHISNTQILSMSIHQIQTHMLIYMHTKLIRNLGAFFSFDHEPLLWVDAYKRWVERLAEAMNLILDKVHNSPADGLRPILTEILASLTNLIDKYNKFANLKDVLPETNWPPVTRELVEKLIVHVSEICFDTDESDDLLLVAIQFIETLACRMEICNNGLDSANIVAATMHFGGLILELKSPDVVILVGGLKMLRQLMNHCNFLNELCSSSSSLLQLASNQQHQQLADKLLDIIASFVMHNSEIVQKLSNLMLDIVKQHEEQYDLFDSTTSKRRFSTYNNKWLKAIKSNRGNESSSDVADKFAWIEKNHANDATELSQSTTAVGKGALWDVHDIASGGAIGIDDDDNFGQLRAVSESLEHETTGGVTSGEPRGGGANSIDTTASGNEMDELSVSCLDDEGDDENISDNSDEPDLNVIDANSMIKHLTSRREIRTELLRR